MGAAACGNRPMSASGFSAHDPNANAERTVYDDAGRLPNLQRLPAGTAKQRHLGDHVVIARSRLDGPDHLVDGLIVRPFSEPAVKGRVSSGETETTPPPDVSASNGQLNHHLAWPLSGLVQVYPEACG